MALPTAPVITSPASGEQFNGVHTLRWNPATDTETPQESLQYQMQYSVDNGALWRNFFPTTVYSLVSAAQVYSGNGILASNGSRKLIITEDGTLVAALISSNTSTSGYFTLLKSTDQGRTWTQIHVSSSSGCYDLSMVAIGNTIALIYGWYYTSSDRRITYRSFDLSGNLIQSYLVETGQTAIYELSLTTNGVGSGLYAAWASKNATYANAMNIRFAQATMTGTTATWYTAKQVTTYTTSIQQASQPCIILIGNTPHIIYRDSVSGINKTTIDGDGGWTSITNIYSKPSSMYDQTQPCAVYVPAHVNGLANGRLWVTWSGVLSTSTGPEILVQYSDNGGSTWSSATQLTSLSQYPQNAPSITADNSGNVCVVWESEVDDGGLQTVLIKGRTFNGTSWGTETIYNGDFAASPQALFDPTFSIGFTYPLFLSKIAMTSVHFNSGSSGSWNKAKQRTDSGITSHTFDFISEPPTTQAKFRVRAYDGTDYGAWSEVTFTIVHKTVIGGYKIVSGTGYPMLLPIYDPAVGMDGKSQLRIEEDGAIGCFELVPVTDDLASPLRVQTSGGTKALGMDVAYIHNWDTQPFSTANTTVNSTTNGILNVTSTSSDPQIMMYNIGSFDPTKYRYIDVRYRTVNGAGGSMEIFFTNSTYTSANGAAYVTASIIMDNTWRTVTLDMGSHAAWTTGGNITGWRFDWATIGGSNLEIDWIRLRA